MRVYRKRCTGVLVAAMVLLASCAAPGEEDSTSAPPTDSGEQSADVIESSVEEPQIRSTAYTLYLDSEAGREPIGHFTFREGRVSSDSVFACSISPDGQYALIGQHLPSGGEGWLIRPYILNLQTAEIYGYPQEYMSLNGWLGYLWAEDGNIYPNELRVPSEFTVGHKLPERGGAPGYYFFEPENFASSAVFFEGADTGPQWEVRRDLQSGDFYLLCTVFSGEDPLTAGQREIHEHRELVCSVYSSEGELRYAHSTGLDWSSVHLFGFTEVPAEFIAYGGKLYFSKAEDWTEDENGMRAPKRMSIIEYDPYANTHRSLYTYDFVGGADYDSFGNIIQKVDGDIVTAHIPTGEGTCRMLINRATGAVDQRGLLPEVSATEWVLGERDEGGIYVVAYETGLSLEPEDAHQPVAIPPGL